MKVLKSLMSSSAQEFAKIGNPNIGTSKNINLSVSKVTEPDWTIILIKCSKKYIIEGTIKNKYLLKISQVL
jgi:hypothetical protein